MKKNIEQQSTKEIPQEHSMGCAVACVAFRSRMTYKMALKLFSQPEHAWTRGFYCSEIVEALYKVGLQYSYTKFKSTIDQQKYLQKIGTIIFVESCKEYPCGHFFIRSSKGWMNPWGNFPSMLGIKAKFQKTVPGNIQYIVFES